MTCEICQRVDATKKLRVRMDFVVYKVDACAACQTRVQSWFRKVYTRKGAATYYPTELLWFREQFAKRGVRVQGRRERKSNKEATA